MCYGQEISNALVRARKKHVCDWCGEPIEPKTKYFRWFGIVEGDPSSTKLHPECDEAITKFNLEGSCWFADGSQPRGGYDPDQPGFYY